MRVHGFLRVGVHGFLAVGNDLSTGESERRPLRGPIDRKRCQAQNAIERDIDRLATPENRCSDVGREEGKRDEAAHISAR